MTKMGTMLTMVNNDSVVVIGTVFDGHGQNWHSVNHWYSVLLVMNNIDTVVTIGTVS